MRKPLLFYVIDERTDVAAYCKRKGMKPIKFIEASLDDQIYKRAVQYSYKSVIYDVLDWNQCYSGFMVTLMRSPKLSYEELIEVALTSKKFGERAGAVGIILKEYTAEFERYLLSTKDMDFDQLPRKKEIVRMATVIYDFIREHNSDVWPLEKILSLCDELRWQSKW